jgi:hypothetical protein
LSLTGRSSATASPGGRDQQRTMLRLSLEPDPSLRGELPLRQGRAIGWITEALAPLRDRMSEAQLRRLAVAIRSAAGIEPLVWLTDIAGLSREDAVQVMRQSAERTQFMAGYPRVTSIWPGAGVGVGFGADASPEVETVTLHACTINRAPQSTERPLDTGCNGP